MADVNLHTGGLFTVNISLMLEPRFHQVTAEIGAQNMIALNADVLNCQGHKAGGRHQQRLGGASVYTCCLTTAGPTVILAH